MSISEGGNSIKLAQGYQKSIDKSMRELIQLAMSLSLDEDICFDLVSKTVKSYSVYCYQNYDRLHMLKAQVSLKEFQFSFKETVFLFKKLLYFFKRDYLGNSFYNQSRVSSFNEMSWVQKSFANLVYVFHFPKPQVLQILDITQSEYLLFSQQIERKLVGENLINEAKDPKFTFNLGHREIMAKARASYKLRVGIERRELSYNLRKHIPHYVYPTKEGLELKRRLERSLVSKNLAY